MDKLLKDFSIILVGIRDSVDYSFLSSNTLKSEGMDLPLSTLYFGKKATIRRAFLNLLYINGPIFLSSFYLWFWSLYCKIPSAIQFHYLIFMLVAYVISIFVNAANQSNISFKSWEKWAIIQKRTSSAVPRASDESNFIQWMADSILQKIFMFGILALIYMPGLLISRFYWDLIFTFPLSCWIYGIFAFQGKLIAQGKKAEDQFNDFERHLFYYIGFGFLITLVTFWMPYFMGTALAALLLPLLSVMAVKAEPVDQQIMPKIPFFFIIWRLFLENSLKWLKSKVESLTFKSSLLKEGQKLME